MNANPLKLAMASPQLTIDKIIFSSQYSVTFAGSGAQSTIFVTPLPAMDAFVFGSFSTDGGATYQDFGAYSFSSKFTIRPSVTGTARFNRGTGNCDFLFSLPSTGMTVLIQFVVVIPTAASLTIGAPVSTTSKLAYRSGGNFQKLFKEGSFTQPNGGAQTTVVAHALGYVPQVRVFSDQGTNLIQMINTVGSEVIKIDENNLTFALGAWGSSARTLYYRVYYES